MNLDLRKYRLHLIGAGLTLLSLLLVLVYMVFGSRPAEKQASLGSALSSEFAPRPVRSDYLYIPAEPEIIPKVILSREPKAAWSAKDALPFWIDPQTLDQAPLRAAAESSIQKLFAPVR